MSSSQHLLAVHDAVKDSKLKTTAASDYGTLTSIGSHPPAPATRSCWSALADTFFFTRGTRIYEISQQRARDVDDALELQAQDSTRVCFEAFNAKYVAHGHSVLKALFFTHGRILSACALGYLFLMGVTIFAPIVLQQVVLAFTTTSGERVDKQNVCLWLAVFIASRLVKSIVSTQTSYGVNIVGLRLVATMRSMLFRKAMRKSLYDATSSQTAIAGSDKHPGSMDIMNLATADVRTLQNTVFLGFNVLVLPIQIAVTTYLLYSVLSVAAFAGVAVILTTLLLNYAISKKMTRSFAELMKIQDKRMKTVREMFSAIQIVKFNAWEPRFKEKLLGERAQELRKLAAYSYAGAASTFLSWSSPLLVSTVSFAVYALVLKETLTAAKVFTSMALFNILRDPLRNLPDTIQLFVQASVSIKRIDSFLKMSEFETNNVTRVTDNSESAALAVQVINGQFSWSNEEKASASVLKDVNFRLEKGDFAVVFGGVGAGKSSLCSALLGEMSKVDGQVIMNGRVAYYSQQPWIQNMSIKSNILFGEPFDADRYDAVLDACCLREDLALFPAGDETEIGEKGVNLSGGQKARVSLARACYAQADIYILDSPLAAVDTVVQKAIFQQCLCGLLADHRVQIRHVSHNPEIIASKFVTCRIGLSNGLVVENTRDQDAAVRGTGYEAQASGTKYGQLKKTGDGVLIHKENREEGHVSGAVWWHYLEAIGGLRVLLLLFVSQLLWQGFQIASDFWLSHWTGSSRQESSEHPEEDSVDFFIETYAGLAAAAAVMVFVKGVIVTYMGLRASRYLFVAMTDGLLHAPLRFFDANPIGRIINRYGGDINAVDVVTPMNMSACMSAVFMVVCSVVTATFVIRSMSVCLLPVVYIYAKIIDGYVRTFRDIRRLMGVVVSPILSHMAQSEHGVETIRAFGDESVRRAINENEKRIDANNVLWYSEVVMIQWFSLRMQLLCVSFLSVVCGSFVVFSDSFSPGIVGLAFTYALNVDASLVTLIKTWSKAENSMVNVERVLEYSSLECEGGNSGSLVQVEPSASWPQRGEITFESVAFSYKPKDPLVLKQVSFAIKSHEKVGIVGRTGAGKSSLTMALFRMNELVSGRILIDGVDIATLPLSALRSRISIIPQSPVLLEGSLRNFLDPFDDFEDTEILQMLEHVELLSTLQGYCESSAEAAVLSLQLSANGDNWSVGERQMLCMARALLKRSAIVVMDEATAAMDHKTERKLSAMIARELKNVTLLTIAHRLTTVMASDRIMVLHEGQVVEFGSPSELLATGDGGVFYGLVQEAKHTQAEKE